MVKRIKRKPPPDNWIKSGAAILTFLVLFSFFISVSQRIVIFRSGILAEVLPRVLIDLTNKNRTDLDLQKLSYSPVLEEAAKRKAEDMAQKSYFAHQSPEGVTPWQWFKDVNYNFVYAGENLAIHFSDSGDVVRAWMNSPGHRDNILNKHFTEIGIATSKGYFEGRETIFVVQMFGRPSVLLASLPVEEEVSIEESPNESILNKTSTNALNINGETTSDDSQLKEVLSENKENEKFIVVKNLLAQNEEVDKTPNNKAIAGQSLDYSSSIEQIIVSPSLFLRIVYLSLGILILFILFLACLVELNKHHYLHIAYGIGLIILMLVIYFVYREFFENVEVLGRFSPFF